MSDVKIASTRFIAAITGLIAFVLLLLTPFLPVKQTEASVSWPQNGSVASVNAPLISLAPQDLEVTVPASSVGELRDGQQLIFGTLPESSNKATDRGLFVTSPDGGLVVTSLNDVLFELTPSQVKKLDDDATLHITVTHEEATVDIEGTSYSETTEDDYRPQVTGMYTELEDKQSLIDDGLSAHMNINSRFTSTPTLLKSIAMWGGLIMALVSLWALRKLDGPRVRRQAKGLTPLDGIVAAVLGFWHVFGANTSDDGFLLTMARVAANTDYMANYYRWYGVPEAPFGSPFYDVLALLSQVTTASMWMRLPALLAGLGTWWLLSREILPRLGPSIADRRVAHWTAAFVFLAFWLPYNNGTRPEPIIALGLMATWALFERAIESGRLAPAAWGTLTAAFTLACGPTGLAAVGVFLISLPAVLRIIGSRPQPRIAYVAPFLGAGLAVMVPVFHDQTLATVLEATAVRSEVGPALNWFEEWTRYATLVEQTVDGSMSRRFPMFVLILCTGLILWALAKGDKTTATTKRMMLILGLSTFFLMFTPTKWTHHFGIYAGIGGAIAAVGAVVLSRIALKSDRNRTFALAAVLFLMALTLAGWNAWWYVSSFAVPWWDRTVQLKGIEANTVVLAIALIVFVVGVVQSMRGPRRISGRWAGVMSAPIAVFAVLMVAFSCLTFVKSFVSQAPAYSVGMGNVKSFKGDVCALGGDVLLEEDTNASFLTPVGGVPLGKSLDAGENIGFTPDGVPAYIASELADTSDRTLEDTQTDDDSADVDPASDEAQSTSRVSTQGNRPKSMRGVNGSTVRLPFGLDYNRVPVAGTFEDEPEQSATLETTWFELPSLDDDRPLLVTSVAGRIAHHDINGIEQEGTELKLEYGTSEDGVVRKLGEVEMLDQGPTMQWRNLRYPLADLPEEADVVRLVAEDTSLAERDWLAVTPLRNPQLTPLNERFDSETPGLLDWTVAFQYPCQRPFYHANGVTEIPEFRIMPDAPGKAQLSGFMDFLGGGALAPAEAVNTSYEIPGYLKDDWQRDWGSVAKYEPRRNSAGEAPALAQVDTQVTTRSGLYTPGPMKVRNPDEQG